jgi:hypothetical protein
MGFWKIILGALAYILEYRKSLLQALIIPMALYVAIEFIPLQESNNLQKFVLGIINALLNTIILVNVHRVILLGPESVPKWGMGWTRRESIFLLHMFVLGLMGISIFFLIMMIMSWLGMAGVYMLVIAGAVIAYFISRLYLVLPSIAVDQKIAFKDSWQMTHEHQFLMILVVVVFPIVGMIPLLLLLYIPYIEYLVAILAMIFMVFTIAIVSVAYKLISTPEPSR